jgi:toxin ParE1/3/4
MAEHKSRIIWSPEALDDIDRLWEYYAGTAGHLTANKLLRDVGMIVATIDDFPHAGRSRDEIERVCARSPPAFMWYSIV